MMELLEQQPPEIADIFALLKSADPDELERMGEARMVAAFQSAAAEVPAYRDLLRQHRVDIAQVTDIATLRRIVPLTDKSTIFQPHGNADRWRHDSLDDLKGILPSSGMFAFSVNTLKNVQNTARMVDLALEYCLNIFGKRTLVLNTYPVGVNISTSVPVANTGVNTDIALAIVRTFASAYEQLVIVGQPLFIKRLVEEGLQHDVDWAGLNTSIVTGGEGFSESWRTYISILIGIKDPGGPADRFVASSMAVGDVDHVFHEIPDTIRIVRAAYRYRPLRHALFGNTIDVPRFFVYYPTQTFVEEIPRTNSAGGELAISLLSPHARNPLIRYKTGHRVKVLSYRALEKILAQHGGIPAPALHMPVVMVFGRKEMIATRNGVVHAETVTEAVFREPDVAEAITGFFKVRADGGDLRVEVQLRDGVVPVRRLQSLLSANIEACLPGVPLRAVLHGFNEYPYSSSHERNVPYIDKR